MKIIIIGGSIGGLCAGIALLERGYDVEIYERSHGEMKDRGAGLVIQPDLIEYLIEQGISTQAVFGVQAAQRQVLNERGIPTSVFPNFTFFTSWNHLWTQLKKFFPDSRYFQGFELETLRENEGKVFATFKNGQIRNADLLIGADGISSKVRQYVSPETDPVYAGYVAYRGLIPEGDLTTKEIEFFSDKFSIYPYANSHFLCYTIPGPGGQLDRGKRLFNWVWYQNKSNIELMELLKDKDGRERIYAVPEGFINKADLEALHKRADEELPAILGQRVFQTHRPFVQVISDMGVEQMYKGNVALLGDAAHLVRPHTASGTAKAYRDAITLSIALGTKTELARSLKGWNEHELAHARALDIHGRQLANRSGLGI